MHLWAAEAGRGRVDSSGRCLKRPARVVENGTRLSPLFLRLAIEQILQGELSSTMPLHLVLRYVEALRLDRIDLNSDDMLRAAAIAGVEAVRERLLPVEIEQPYLRGILRAEADDDPFMNATNDADTEPAAIIDMLTSSGLLNRNRTNRRLQFAYDPVAEYLAAWRVSRSTRSEATESIRERIIGSPDTAVAKAVAEIEEGLS